MIKIGILGATGYTGVELIRLLLNHPEAKIIFASSETFAGKKLSEVYPSLTLGTGPSLFLKEEIGLENFQETPQFIEALAKKIDLLFIAYPHGKAVTIAPQFLRIGVKVIDLSADFRLKDAAVFEKWYATKGPENQVLREAVYGLPEIYREKIKKANLVANPGCYPTAVILALLPLLKEKLIDLENIFVDAKSGISGAGRTAKETNTFSFCDENFLAYSVEGHRHQPEIEQELENLAGEEIKIVFQTHLVPMNRGIFATIYSNFKKTISPEKLREIYQKYYSREKFVRVLADGTWPATKNVFGSNFCDLNFKIQPPGGKIVIFAAIDNLVKGASGQAVQNMNLMFGQEESAGLEQLPIFP